MIDSRAGTGTDRQQAPYTCAETITEQVETICIEEASASGSKVTDASGQPGGQPDPAPKERNEADNTENRKQVRGKISEAPKHTLRSAENTTRTEAKAGGRRQTQQIPALARTHTDRATKRVKEIEEIPTWVEIYAGAALSTSQGSIPEESRSSVEAAIHTEADIGPQKGI